MIKKKTKKLLKYLQMIFICAFIGALIALVSGFAIEKYFNDYLNLAWVNFSFKFRQEYYPEKNVPSKDIVVVSFDDETDKVLHEDYPYNRSLFARAIEFLRLSGAEAILFDIIFTDEIAANPESDKFLVEATKKAGNVYLGTKIFESDIKDVKEQQLAAKFAINLTTVDGQKVSKEDYYISPTSLNDMPFTALANATKNVGFVNSSKEGKKDVVRSGWLVACDKENCYSTLPFSYYLDFMKTKKVIANPGKYLQVKDQKIPLEGFNNFDINWYKSNKAEMIDGKKYCLYDQQKAYFLIQTYDQILELSKKYHKTVDEVFNDWYFDRDQRILDELVMRIDPDTFKDKIVFVAISSSGAQDFVMTPFGEMPGVFVHAYILDNILNHNFTKRLGLISNFMILFLLCLLISGTIIYVSSKNWSILQVLSVIYLIAFSCLTLYLFGAFNILINWSTSIIGGISTIFLSMTYYSFVEGKDKKQIKRAMANYISPQIMNIVLENPELLKPDAITRKTITIFFFDIRSFTTITENNPPELIAKMLNEYHSEIINIIFNNKGTLDKIIGDAIMAFWNAPVDIEDHPFLAVKSALEIKEKLQALNVVWGKVFNHYIDFGIGINTDDVVVGNIGSEKFMDYTVIGDGVNLASRLEGLNKNYGTNIIISDYTYNYVRDKTNVKYLGKAKVKGKSVDTNIYELLGFNESYLKQVKDDGDEKG